MVSIGSGLNDICMGKIMNDIVKLIAGITLLVFVVGIGPLLVIWSLNTLFHLGIGYSASEWAAMALLTSLFFGNVRSK